jgi:DNA-binding SARP family transcriptional activator
MLRVRLFGGLALESDGVPLPLPERRRACSLLGWLALHPGMHPRSEVAGRFWPEVLDSSARKSLRTELVAVRHSLGEGVLAATRDAVGLAGDALFVDAREFDRLVGEGRLPEAVALCDGELLAGLDDEWIYEAREMHRHRLGEVLERVAADAETAGELETAVRISRRRVALDPLREDAHRELIRRLIGAGEASAARLAFDDLARRLRADLRVAPSRETRRLLDAISAHDGAPAGVTAGSVPPLPPALARRDHSPFIGREGAVAWLRAQ